MRLRIKQLLSREPDRHRPGHCPQTGTGRADICLVEWNPETGAQTAKEIETLGRRTLRLSVDVANRTQVEEMARQVLAQWGKVDILVNNAGFDRAQPC